MDNKKAKKRKFNLLDVVIILALLGIIAFAAYKLLPTEAAAATSKVTMKFYAEAIPSYVADEIYVGAPVIDADRSVYLGEVTDIYKETYVQYEPNAEGKLVANEIETSYNLIITTSVNAAASAYGASLSGVVYGVGHTAAVRAGFAKMNVTVYGVEYDDPSIPEAHAKAITG